MIAKRKVPEIRFKGFSGEWECRTLEDESIEIVAGGDIDKSKITDSGKFPVLANALTNDGIVGYYNCDYRVKAPAVTVTGRGDVGHAKARKYNFTPVVRLLSVTTKHDVDFLEKAINNHEVMVESTGVPQLTVPQLSKFQIFFPKTDDEEKVIGTFFQNLDSLITLHQRKYDKLTIVKKAMLEKMFPKDGADVPEIRFKGFTEKWELRQVGDVIEDYIEKTSMQNQYPVLTSSQQQGIVLQESYFANRQVTTDKNIGYFVLPKGYFTYRSRSDTDLFVFNRNDIIDKGVISYFYPVFKAKDADSDFFLRRINYGAKQQLAMAAEGTGQRVLSHTKFKKMTLLFPLIEEQQQIGSFFQILDSLITLQQRELDKLKNIKKACLEKMFV